MVDARGAQIVHQDMRDFRLSFSRVSGYDWSPETYAAYAALIPEDPRLDLFLERSGQAVHCRMEMTDAEYHRSRVYREVLRDAGVEYLCGVNFGEDRQHMSGMLLLRDLSQPPFSESDCARFQLFVPHIRRVLTLHGFIGQLEQENRISRDTLDALGAGVIVVDGNGKIEIANKAARTLLMEDGKMRDVAGQLHCETRIGEALDDMLRLVRSSQSMHPFEILRDGGDPLLVFMSPHEASHGRFDLEPPGDDGAVIVIRTSDLRQNLAGQARVLELLWNLTPSQARLACLLSDGESLQSAAAELGITEASARQYLKLVFRKLRVNRQSDMLRKVLSVLVSAKSD
jgi:DNA-binding CsgD family transcriptional regulator/PAS domain-containing protein